jgi:hypothetical protein
VANPETSARAWLNLAGVFADLLAKSDWLATVLSAATVVF